MVFILRSALRAKRFYLSTTGAVIAAGTAYALLNQHRLEGEIGWTESLIGTLAAYAIVKRVILFAWDRSDMFIRKQFRTAAKNLKNKKN